MCIEYLVFWQMSLVCLVSQECLLIAWCHGNVCWLPGVTGMSVDCLWCHRNVCWLPGVTGMSVDCLVSWECLLIAWCHGNVCWLPGVTGMSVDCLVSWECLLIVHWISGVLTNQPSLSGVTGMSVDCLVSRECLLIAWCHGNVCWFLVSQECLLIAWCHGNLFWLTLISGVMGIFVVRFNKRETLSVQVSKNDRTVLHQI